MRSANYGLWDAAFRLVCAHVCVCLCVCALHTLCSVQHDYMSMQGFVKLPRGTCHNPCIHRILILHLSFSLFPLRLCHPFPSLCPPGIRIVVSRVNCFSVHVCITEWDRTWQGHHMFIQCNLNHSRSRSMKHLMLSLEYVMSLQTTQVAVYSHVCPHSYIGNTFGIEICLKRWLSVCFGERSSLYKLVLPVNIFQWETCYLYWYRTWSQLCNNNHLRLNLNKTCELVVDYNASDLDVAAKKL